MVYTDNTRGFRRRNVITKLETLLHDIRFNMEYIQDTLNHDNDWMMDEEYNQWIHELEDLELDGLPEAGDGDTGASL